MSLLTQYFNASSTWSYADPSSDYSNQSPNQQRNLKPTVTSSGTYSASPSQLTLSTDQLPTAALGQHTYQQYTYTHPAPFVFPQQPQYGQAHQQAPGHHQQLQQPGQQLQSPTSSRKRRASELEDTLLSGSASSNTTTFGNAGMPFSASSGDVDLSTLGSRNAPPLPSPAPKKGRTNTPWTPAEEQRLKALRDAGASWSEIAKTFPTRTEGSVKKHWYKVGCLFAKAAESDPETYAHQSFCAGHALCRFCGRRGQQFRSPPCDKLCDSVPADCM